MSSKAIVATRVLTGMGWRDNAAVVVQQGRIAQVVDAASIAQGTDLDIEILPAGAVLAPGLMDVQVNGGGGVLLNTSPDLATIRTMITAHRRTGGTTGMLPTLITDVPDKMQALADIGSEAMKIPGVLGFHLEGPFLNVARKGVHRAEFIRRPMHDDMLAMRRFAALGTSLITLAPESAGDAVIRDLTTAGLRICAGHCEPTFDTMRTAADRGLTGITHLFNALAPLSARTPGAIGAAFDDDRLFCGLIADGHHVSASNMRLALKVKGPERILLVTDAMATSASNVTSFELQGRRIELVDGRLTAGPDTLAGAHLTMLEAVRRMVDVTGCDIGAALTMGSRTPAVFLGRGNTHGLIEAGYAADLVAFDPQVWTVHATWVAGVRDAA